MNLFIKKRFQMHSGGFSDFKLECDALNTDDLQTLAFLVSKKMPFQKAIGVPRGGLAFANALNKYTDSKSKNILIADDVLTTGRSMIEVRKELILKENLSNILGIVIFARGKCPAWITPMLSLNEMFWQND